MAVEELNLPEFEYFLESGGLALHDGFVVTFFLPENHQNISRNILDATEHFMGLPGMTETFGTVDDDGYPVLRDKPEIRNIIEEKLKSSHLETNLQIIDTTEGASNFSIRYYGFNKETRIKNNWPNAVSGINFTFPTDYHGEQGLLQLLSFSNELSTMLPFSFGYVSPAFVYHEGVGEPAAFEMISRLSKRFKCLDIPALLVDCLEIGDSPKCPCWGNYFGKSTVERFGGEDEIRRHFTDQDVRIRSHDNGSISIFLSPVPISGDVNRRQDITVFQHAHNLYAKFMTPRHVPYMNFDEETMFDWLHRFKSDLDD
jgi:hypothetical protein